MALTLLACCSGFQSTPPREGRPRPTRIPASWTAFQSTPPREGRPAPHRRVKKLGRSFNPRPRVRGDNINPSVICRVGLFQSTPPREGRRVLTMATGMNQRFNPRPRVRGDDAPNRGAHIQAMFQSTPPREGRQSTGVIRMRPREFQSTPPREGRPPTIQVTPGCSPVSIHAPA